MKYLVAYSDTEMDSFGYDKHSGMGPGVISRKVTKTRLFDNKDKAIDFSKESWVQTGDPIVYECIELTDEGI